MGNIDNSSLERRIKEVISGSIKTSIDAYAKEREKDQSQSTSIPFRWGDSLDLEDARSRHSVDPNLRVKFLRHDSVDVTDSDLSSAENPWFTQLFT